MEAIRKREGREKEDDRGNEKDEGRATKGVVSAWPTPHNMGQLIQFSSWYLMHNVYLGQIVLVRAFAECALICKSLVVGSY